MRYKRAKKKEPEEKKCEDCGGYGLDHVNIHGDSWFWNWWNAGPHYVCRECIRKDYELVVKFQGPRL